MNFYRSDYRLTMPNKLRPKVVPSDEVVVIAQLYEYELCDLTLYRRDAGTFIFRVASRPAAVIYLNANLPPIQDGDETYSFWEIIDCIALDRYVNPIPPACVIHRNTQGQFKKRQPLTLVTGAPPQPKRKFDL